MSIIRHINTSGMSNQMICHKRAHVQFSLSNVDVQHPALRDLNRPSSVSVVVFWSIRSLSARPFDMVVHRIIFSEENLQKVCSQVACQLYCKQRTWGYDHPACCDKITESIVILTIKFIQNLIVLYWMEFAKCAATVNKCNCWLQWRGSAEQHTLGIGYENLVQQL